MERFSGSPEKLKRAGEHIAQLTREIEDFMNGYFRTDAHYNITIASTGRDVGVGPFPQMHFDLPIPAMRWGVLVGDAVHDLRSALDNAVNALTVEHSGRSLPRTGFPIFLEESRFRGSLESAAPRGSGREALRGVAEPVAKCIQELQPFRSSDPSAHPLWLLHEISNSDKHHVPVIVATYSELPRVGLVDEIEGSGTTDESRLLPFAEGLMRVRDVAAEENQKRMIRFEFQVATLFGPGPAEGNPVIPTLHRIESEVESVLTQLGPQPAVD